MHELSIIQALLQQVRPYTDKNIRRICIEVGGLSCVDPDRLQFCFEMVKEEAALSKAELVIDNPCGQARCNNCQKLFELVRLGLPCPCGSYNYTLISGQQLTLTEIEFT
ncbi:hydrogenase maturation nickel metallochaperone HypA [Spartinivicinus poritis]|uniref:Hydrogenase maturation factor HypA n=1 Tax=Spartinivicinus poritis TaxID=2994640 RepID=A0ABT5U4B4_9GAMM|nr:hydrogenase maturation nickel metallochaperone HypA [Spartinivicinus sp. A2-2]MDE1460816.1 hydrogenase maturation nickel metallochaperone HypA [Spartinivicinus sp. A2-2]